MITREQVTNFLRINHIPADASDDVITDALVAAWWDADDVACALLVLRDASVQGSGESFVNLYSDRAMSPNAISSLLNVDVRLTQVNTIENVSPDTELREARIQSIYMFFASLIVAGGIGLLSMYYLHIGPFY